MVLISDNLEDRLRGHLQKQGDLSRIVTEALESQVSSNLNLERPVWNALRSLAPYDILPMLVATSV